jgi:hypothetical protein
LSPSEAQAFALTQVLRIDPGGDPIAAVEAFVASQGLGDELAAHRAAWARAAARTPHGVPIELAPDDFRPHSSTAGGSTEAAESVTSIWASRP